MSKKINLKILQEVQGNFLILGIDSDQSRMNRKSVLVCFIYGLGTTLSALFLICNANSFQEYTNNLYITTTLAVGLFCIVNMILKVYDLFDLVDNFENTFDKKSENPTSKAIYEHTNRQVEKISQIGHYVVAIATPVCIILPKAAISYFMFFATGFNDVAFELPLFFWFPFNWRNPIGYFVAVIIEYIPIAYHYTFLACTVSFGVGLFFFVISFTKDLKNDLKSFNENAKIPKNRLQTLEQISDFIQVYSTFKRYIGEFLDIYQPIFVIIYIWSMVTICGVMLLVQIQIEGNSSLALVLATGFYASYAYGIILIICDLGQRITNAFGEIGHEIEAFEWNLFSLELQKMLPIILIGVRQSVELCIFGSTSGLRETFTKVVNNAFSYFAVVRQFLK